MSQPEFTTQSFLDWLRNQPKDRAYNYWDKGNCAVANFARDILGFDGTCYASSVSVSDSENHFIIPKQVALAINNLYVGSPTFTAGQLLEKLTAV